MAAFELVNDTTMLKEARQLLKKAEGMYLARETAYAFTGVRIGTDGHCPRVDFEGNDGIVILLTPSAKKIKDQRFYQIAHEVIHLLTPRPCPSDIPPATMLEEGVATYFSIEGPNFSPGYKQAVIDWFQQPDSRNWAEALQLYEELIAIEPDAIRLLRRQVSSFHDMTTEVIRQIIPDVSEELARKLVERRHMPVNGL